MTTHIIGAGMAGLLAANMLSDTDSDIIVHEQAKELPNNHGAVLRFRSSIVADVTNIPFKRVNMIKSYVPWRNPIADTMAYSAKVTGTHRSDRSLPLEVYSEERHIAPPDFIDQLYRRALARGVQFKFEVKVGTEEIQRCHAMQEQIISTIPMSRMKMLLGGDNRVQFEAKSLVNIRANLKWTEAYVSLYIPDPHHAATRMSITGDELIIECPSSALSVLREDIMEQQTASVLQSCLEMFGFEEQHIVGESSWKQQQYGKILPIDDKIRKSIIYELTDKFGIYSLGRFATWRPGLLLDDLVKDIRLIQGWMHSSAYDIKKAR